jgi:WD40 repeat protein
MSSRARVSELLLRWEELREQGQPASPEELCRDCPEQLPELRRLIQALEAMEPALASESEAATFPPVPSEDGDRTGPAPTVAGYEVLGELDRGGMGVVYKARHVALNRVVALKMILAGGHAGEHELTRFRTEAEAVARLRHPNIVQIYEVGEQDGKPFFSLEYCEGGSLESKLGGTPLPPRDAARLVETLARAMEAAHAVGVVHRDLKPANVLLTGDGQPKISDFGLAKKLDAGTGQTASGDVMGTPPYMAPEQAGGRSKEVGPPADIYALGAVLYECLTGRPPFKAARPLDTLLQVLSEEPVRPRLLQPRTPADLETICLKCLEKQPGRRYGSAGALADDLGRFLVGKPVQARPVSGAERALKWVRRHPARTAAYALLVLALVLGLGGGSVARLWQKAEVARDEAEAARHDALGARDRMADALRGEQEAKLQADSARRQLRRLSYFRSVDLAHREWREAHVGRALHLLTDCPADLRGWEWHYVHYLCCSDLHTLRGHTGEVCSVAFSPDGKHLASASADSTVKIWDTTTGQETLTLQGHTDAVWSVAFSPDGQRLASASQDKTVKVWDAQTGKETRSLPGHTSGVRSVAFSPEGKHLASTAGVWDGLKRQWISGEVKVWDAATGQLIRSLHGHTDAVRSVAFSPDGERLASVSEDSTVKLWDVATGGLTLTLQGHTGFVRSVAFSPDGKRLAGASHDQTVKVWDAQTGRLTRSLHGHTDAVESVAFSPDGKRLASASWDHTVKVWDVQTGQVDRTFKGHCSFVRGVVFSPDGQRLASASADQTAKVWDAQTDQESLTLRGHTGRVSRVAFSPDGKRLAGPYSPEAKIKVWDAQTGREVLTLQGHRGEVSSVAFSPDGLRLAGTSWDDAVKVWDARTGCETLSLTGHSRWVHSVAFSPGGQLLASASWDGTVKVWDARTAREIFTLAAHAGPVFGVCFSPDGLRLASASRDGTLKVWDAQTGRESFTLRGHTGPVYSVLFSPDGQRLASASEDMSVKMWDSRTGQEVFTVVGHLGPVMSLAFSPDGERLASGGVGGILKVWDTQTGQEVLSLQGHTSPVTGLAFSPDGQRLASATSRIDSKQPGEVKVWTATPIPPAARAKTRK